MNNNNIDNEKLILEIESLDDDKESDSINNYKNNKNWLIIIIIIVVLIGISILYFKDTDSYDFYNEVNEEYTDKQIDNYLEQESLTMKNFEIQKNNISVENSFLNYDKQLLAVISNDNDEVITDLKVQVIFYNGENKPIQIDESNISIIEKNSKCYIKFENTPENFERYDFLISKDYFWYDNLEFVTQQISYEVSENGDYTDLIVKNNYSKKVSEIYFQVLYFDENNNVIDVENINFWDLKKNETQCEELYLTLFDKSYEKVKYERYEINILGAFIY